MLSKGTILNNRYRIEEVVGRGGLSVVYKAFDLEANGAVRAVKEISKSCTEMVASAKQESKLIKELYEADKSNFFPNIIQHAETRDSFYIVMDYIDGASMSSVLKSGALPHPLVLEYGKEICSVMQFLHDYGKIYSDMKPDNIMIINKESTIRSSLSSNRRSGLLKFIDFGAVVQMESGVPLQYTPEYAAPEQFRAEHLDKRTDIFNIGATIYHMVTGKKPLPVCDRNRNFRSSGKRFVFDPKDRKTDYTLRKIIAKCTEDDPEKRYRSCHELYHALEKAEKNSNIKLTLFTAAAAVITGAVCLFSYGEYRSKEIMNYDQLIMRAEKSASGSEKTEAYRQAAKLRPEKTKAYFGLMEAYKEDVSFTEDESYELIRLMTTNLSELKNDPEYELMAFEAGKLYWYYYDYGADGNDDNTTTRMKASSEWFSDALNEDMRIISEKKYQMAKVYHDIADFHAEIQKLVIEGDDSEVYSDYWHSLTEMKQFVMSSQTETEIVLLETYRLIINSINTYAYKFSSFIEEDEMRDLFSEVKAETDRLVTTTEKTGQIRQSIIDSYSAADKAINRAYGGKQ
ncbi:serine/threonine-protein kinase [Ruminococcus sp. HUN007]|uniref:serine/threonine protein kinase n=1 Tax=Ruminococcus sp. HUN007 TaxID=1514668 RepID=UPI0005D25910|nr:serine/threonine-protein kinase [Ruminococcus sp. HUN007]